MTILKIIARTGEAAKLPFPVHPHMLRHSTEVTSSPTMGMTPEPSSTIWAIKISCTRFATPKWRLIGSRISGRTDC